MAQSGYTPVQLYYSTTASAVPTAANLLSGELAINITDRKLFAKDNAETVFTLSDPNSTVYTTGSYSNPAWITSLSETKVLPTQTNNSGKYLTTDGTSTSWATVSLPAGQTAGSATSGYLQYAGTTGTDGQLYGGTTAPTNTTRLNYDGNLHATTFVGALTGNASTSSTWQTARTLTIGATGKSVDGSANVTWTRAEIVGALPVSGAWFSGGPPVVGGDGVMEIGRYIDFHATNTATSDFDGRLECTGANTFTFGSGSVVSATTVNASLTGNASTATTLQTARNINGVSFNGSANITITASTTQALTFNNGGTGVASGTTFDGGTARTVSYNTIGAPSTTGTNASGSWGISVTGSAATFTSTTQNSQFNSIGVGTAASTTAGEIRATNNITAYYSDERLKTKLGNIKNALAKICTINGFYHEANELAQSLGYEKVREVGVSAQEVQKVLPEVVVPAPIDDKYLTVRYEKIVPLLIEAIKELKSEIDNLKKGIK